ncbi:hypothetical protein [Microbacterium sp.]|uniref:hypothetical protein n=1 Tax=Microbacterium sp. TaxID=51671 RepID=UPI00260CCF00|nr:hypothetical protein [Microbacterium sp.]
MSTEGHVYEVTPQPLFDLAQYEVEHRPSIDRQEKMQRAALDERNDEALTRDTRIMHLRRMVRFAETLIAQLQEEMDDAHIDRPKKTRGRTTR